MSLYRCRFREGDAQFCEPYALKHDPSFAGNHRTYSCEASHFHVDHSVIYIDTSDTIRGVDKPRSCTTAKNGHYTIHSRVVVLPDSDTNHQEWLQKIGVHIAKVMFNKLPEDGAFYSNVFWIGSQAPIDANQPFTLGEFPDGMLLYRRDKTHSDRAGHRRSDVYLRSVFESSDIQVLYSDIPSSIMRYVSITRGVRKACDVVNGWYAAGYCTKLVVPMQVLRWQPTNTNNERPGFTCGTR